MQTTMTASEFEKNVEQLLQMVRNGTDLTLKVVATKKRGWSEEVLNHLRNPNPNWHLEPDPFPREHSSIIVTDPFSDSPEE